jgi:hypothetical protein
MNRYAYAKSSPFMRTDRKGLFNEGVAAGGDTLGHGDFDGSINNRGPFNYNRQDTDPNTEPFTHPSSHFRDQTDVEGDLPAAVSACSVDAFQRLMHQGQDYFVHFKKGFRWWSGGHVRPGIIPWFNYSPMPYVNIPIPQIEPGHRFDDDPAAWNDANDWTKSWLENWASNCGCSRGR